MGRISSADDWCILRTSGPHTMALARSLESAGIEAWTPIGTATRRRGPQRERVKVRVPIMPTFVFARARHVGELQRCRSMPKNPHGDFSIFQLCNRIGYVADHDLAAIRTEERRQTPRVFPKDALVTIPSGAWTGLTGVIDRVEGKHVIAWFNCFGRSVEVKIETCELPDDAIETGSSSKGMAAQAAQAIAHGSATVATTAGSVRSRRTATALSKKPFGTAA